MPPFARLAGFALVLAFVGAFVGPRFAFAQPHKQIYPIPPTPKPTPLPSPTPASEPPQVPPIEAEFSPPNSMTTYSLVGKKSDFASWANHKWNLTLQCIDAGCPDPSGTLEKPKPAIDSRCRKTVNLLYEFEYGFGFRWFHGDLDGCDHKKEGPSGHQGLITLTFDDGPWVCTAKYYGTHSGTGPPPVCVKTIQKKIYRRLPI